VIFIGHKRHNKCPRSRRCHLRRTSVVLRSRGDIHLRALAPGDSIIRAHDGLDGEQRESIFRRLEDAQNARRSSGGCEVGAARHAVAARRSPTCNRCRRGPGDAIVGRSTHEDVLVSSAVFRGVVYLNYTALGDAYERFPETIVRCSRCTLIHLRQERPRLSVIMRNTRGYAVESIYTRRRPVVITERRENVPVRELHKEEVVEVTRAGRHRAPGALKVRAPSVERVTVRMCVAPLKAVNDPSTLPSDRCVRRG